MLARLRDRAVAALGLALAGVLAPSAHAQPALSARITAVETPAGLDRAEVATAVLDVRNTGTDAWPAAGDVRLAYHWLRADGSVVVGGGRRTHLPTLVPPGGSVRLCALVEAPGEAGPLRLEWDLVKEGVAWFSHRDADSLLRQTVVVRAGTSGTAGGRPLALAGWILVSIAHLAIGVAWATRRRRPAADASLDAWLFDAVVFVAGTLHGVLFVAATTTGLSGARGVWWLAGFDALVALALWRSSRASPAAEAPASVVPTPRVLIALQAAGALALGTLAVSWVRHAARSLHVSGSDAAHYHVPNVVNLAIGASPFDLMPTPHAYPMGASLVGAWFVLPVCDPWLIELAMLLFFALLAVSLVRAFTLATGAPGLAWVPWLLLAVMGTPLFQTASLFSADLPFAAAFAAAATHLVAFRRRDCSTVDDAISAGLAFGLLCGVKTTGTPMTALLLGVAAVIWLTHRARRAAAAGEAVPTPRPRAAPPARPAPANSCSTLKGPLATARAACGRQQARTGLVAVAVVAWLAGGGAWLVRNEMRFGSPVAPSGLRVMGVTIFAGETLAESASYYSVAGDMAAAPDYPLRRKVAFFVRRWLGAVAQPVAALLLLLVVDLGVQRWRRSRAAGARPPGGDDDPRLAMLVGGAVVAAVFLWLLANAPWSSLDWTRGLSLRYALPIIVGVAFVTFLGLFPRSWPWHAEALPAAIGGVCLAAVACVILIRGRAGIPDSSPDPVPGLDWTSCVVAAGLLAALWLATRGRVARLAAIGLMAAGVWPVATRLAAHDAALVVEAQREEARLVRCLGTSPEADEDRHRAIHVAMVAAERGRGVVCPSRRVYLGAAFDLPLELGSLPYTTLVFDARQAAAAEPTALADAGRSACDYLLVTRAELETTRGSRLLQQTSARPWTPVAERGGFVAFATTAAPGPSK